MGPTRMTLSKPVIAAIDGYAVAGGMELALWCDLRVMEEDAILGVFCRRWGVPLIDGGTVRLPRIIGAGRALDLILTGRAVGATEALAMGLVSRVVEQGYVRSAALDLAEEIASFPESLHARGPTLDVRRARSRRSRGHGDRVRPRETSLGADMREHVSRFVSGEGRHGELQEMSRCHSSPVGMVRDSGGTLIDATECRSPTHFLHGAILIIGLEESMSVTNERRAEAFASQRH